MSVKVSQVTHAPHANVRVHVPRVIVAIDRTGTAMHPVIPIAAANEGVQARNRVPHTVRINSFPKILFPFPTLDGFNYAAHYLADFL